MDERIRFIARLLEGEKMTAVCREFGISRTTGYKLFNRHRTCGLHRGWTIKAAGPIVMPTGLFIPKKC